MQVRACGGLTDHEETNWGKTGGKSKGGVREENGGTEKREKQSTTSFRYWFGWLSPLEKEMEIELPVSTSLSALFSLWKIPFSYTMRVDIPWRRQMDAGSLQTRQKLQRRRIEILAYQVGPRVNINPARVIISVKPSRARQHFLK
ncbi:hypothetical protein ACFX2J_000655 [Malus domestica]